jgi:hypothetical protein
VGIDRADDGDAPDRGPARRADPRADAAPLLDPADRAAEHTRYRGNVEQTYAAVPDAWAEALPSLHSAWEEHVEKYPERTRLAPRTQPDGSWVADGGRKLTPEQNADVDRGVAHIREVGKNVIVPDMRAVEAEDATRCLAGFERRFKGEDRLKEKVADQVRSTPELTPTDALATIPDVVRFTFQYSETAYTAGVLHDIERLEAHGFTQVERRNTWIDDQYKGINSRWREPESSMLFEVQFHTQASLEAKELTHKAYERIRSTAQDPELAELKEFQRRVNSMIPIPPDVTEIEDYPPGET